MRKDDLIVFTSVIVLIIIAVSILLNPEIFIIKGPQQTETTTTITTTTTATTTTTTTTATTTYTKTRTLTYCVSCQYSGVPKVFSYVDKGIYWPEDRIFPAFAKPDILYVVDLRGTPFNNDFKYLPLVTLQGLVARDKPRIYVIYQDIDAEWLEVLIRYNIVKVKFVDIDFVIEKFKNYTKGYIVYDPNLPDTVNIATTMAGLYDAIVVHPYDEQWIKSFGIQKLFDLRGMFSDKYSAYLWAYNNLWPKCNHRLLVPMVPCRDPDTLYMQIAVRDYVVALKLFVHYLNPYDPKERELFIRLLKDMPNGTAVLGWYEESEAETVSLASKYGKFVVVMCHHYGPLALANPTVWSGLQVKDIRFKLPPIRLQNLGYNGVYLTFYVTDGDNLQLVYSIKHLWDDNLHGKIPIAWTISPYTMDVMPLVAYYYLSRMTENDTFVSGPSGAGYWYPTVNHDFLSLYLNITERYFLRTGLNITEILGYDDEAGEQYIKVLNPIAIKKEYNEVHLLYFRAVGQGAYYLEDYPNPIVFAVIHYRDDSSDIFLDLLNATIHTVKTRPLFVLVVSQPWQIKNFSTLFNIVHEISVKFREIKIVNFHEFCMLLNPRYGLYIAKSIIERAQNIAGNEEIIAEAKELLSIAEQYYNEKQWLNATYELNKVFNILRNLRGLDIIELYDGVNEIIIIPDP